MAERPDLDYWLPILERELTGRRIAAVRVKKPVVLRLALPGSPAELLVGRGFGRVFRRGHFAVFELAGPEEHRPARSDGGEAGAPVDLVDLVIAPMLAGRFALHAAAERAPADLAVAFALDDGRELRYRDDVQMGKVYVVAHGEWRQVPGLEAIGVDVLDPSAFTLERFRALARARRDQAKVFLMDRSALDAMGNAYADEALFAAGVHPKTWIKSLGDEELARLHRAISDVLARAAAEIARRKPPLEEKLRDFLSVRGKNRQPCPRCGTPIRTAGVHGHDAFFCPSCQPETRRSAIVSWDKLGAARSGDGAGGASAGGGAGEAGGVGRVKAPGARRRRR
ncbi:MAG TPA: DNA-formamidopyrimidine glycosylase family protein [Kofleriaceae bacterium]|nr:DNA-formamidopyrimidine glycosylase family protein [Kofleriaceae bacterium]